MIYLKLRQAGEPVNHKRVERLYAEARLQVRRRRRKKIPAAERQPLVRPHAPNEVWSADFVFDRTADGRVVKCLTIVDDATTRGRGHCAGACPRGRACPHASSIVWHSLAASRASCVQTTAQNSVAAPC